MFGYEEKTIFPIYISKERHEKELDLLLIEEEENQHHVLKKGFDRVMFGITGFEGRKHFCKYFPTLQYYGGTRCS